MYRSFPKNKAAGEENVEHNTLPEKSPCGEATVGTGSDGDVCQLPDRAGRYSIILTDAISRDANVVACFLEGSLSIQNHLGVYAMRTRPCILLKNLYEGFARSLQRQLQDLGLEILVRKQPIRKGKYFSITIDAFSIRLEAQDPVIIKNALADTKCLTRHEIDDISACLPCIVAKNLPPATAEKWTRYLDQYYGIKATAYKARITDIQNEL